MKALLLCEGFMTYKLYARRGEDDVALGLALREHQWGILSEPAYLCHRLPSVPCRLVSLSHNSCPCRRDDG